MPQCNCAQCVATRASQGAVIASMAQGQTGNAPPPSTLGGSPWTMGNPAGPTWVTASEIIQATAPVDNGPDEPDDSAYDDEPEDDPFDEDDGPVGVPLVGPGKFGLPPDYSGGGSSNLPPCSECGRNWIKHSGWDCVEYPPTTTAGAAHNFGLSAQPATKPGPIFRVSKLDKSTNMRSCCTCGGVYADQDFEKSADDMYLCKRQCYAQFGTCSYCGWRPERDKFTAKIWTHMYCEECGPTKPKKLDVKQKQQFTPKMDVIQIRREKVWRNQK